MSNFVNNYTGNNDFRGYLAKNDPSALAYTGNDGGVNTSALEQSLYGTGRVLGNTATAIRYQQSAGNNDANAQTMAYMPDAMKSLYNQWYAANNAAASQNTTNTGGGSGGYSSGGSTSSWSPSNEASYQAASQVANSALGRIPGELSTALRNIDSQYGQKNNELSSAMNQATSQYNNGVTSNQQDKLSNNNLINQNAGQGYQSMLRVLGGMGAGGGSEAKYLVPQLVQDQANTQLGQAGQTYAKNALALDTNYNNFKDQNKNQVAQLNDWETQQVNSAKSQSAQSQQSLEQQLAQLAGQRAAAMGGNGVAAEQPYIDKINALAGNIDSLAAFNPTYTGTTATYQGPSLDSYQTAAGAKTQVTPTQQSQGATTPYMAMLLSQQQKKQQSQPALA